MAAPAIAPRREEMGDDETFVVLVSLAVGVWWLIRWYGAVAGATTLGVRPRSRAPLYLLPPFGLMMLYFVLVRFAAVEVRTDYRYVGLFMCAGVAWLGSATWLFALLGISVRDDAIDARNPAALAAVSGAMFAVLLCFAGANMGEGPTIWNTIFTAFCSTGALFLLWLVLEKAADVSEAVVVERDLATGLRLGGVLVALGLVLCRAGAGDWEGFGPMLRDLGFHGWPTLPLTAAGIVLQRLCRPTPRRPVPGAFACGIAPALALMLAAVLYLWGVKEGRP